MPQNSKGRDMEKKKTVERGATEGKNARMADASKRTVEIERIAAAQAQVPSGEKNASEKRYTKREFDEAIRRKMEMATKDMQKRMEQHPYYQEGKRRMEQMQNGRPAMTGAANNAGAMRNGGGAQRQEIAKHIAAQIAEGMRSGRLPEDFNLDEYIAIYPSFIEDCARFGLFAAIRTVQALKGMSGRRERMQALPTPSRPSFAQVQGGPVDYNSMSDEEFERVKQGMHDKYMQGKTVYIR